MLPLVYSLNLYTVLFI